MNHDTLLALRRVTAGDAFRARRRILEQELVMTPSLQNIIVEVEKIHAQIADVNDPARPWSADNRHKVEGLALIGNAGTGKTHGIDTACHLLSSVTVGEGQEFEPKIISVTTPPTGTAGALAREMIVRSGLPIIREPRDRDAPAKVLSSMARAKPSLLVVDEASRCASPAILTAAEIRRHSGLMWTIAMSLLDSTAWPTPLVITGLPCLIDSLYLPDPDEKILRVRGEASRRFRKIRIPDATIDVDGRFIEKVIAKYCRRLGVGSTLKESDEIGARLIHSSNRAFGTALVIAQGAVALARTRDGDKGKLKRDDFAAIYHFMSGGSVQANPFAVDDWSRINPEVVMPESIEDARFKEHDDDE